MPTATLTWSTNYGDSNAQSTFAATALGALQLLNQYFTALAAFSDVPWQVCSFNDSVAPYYLTLKRKTGSAGRILFVVPTSNPGTTYNPQLGNLSWSNSNMRIAFFPSATSDTPANILATSGDVFTNPAGGSGLGPSFATTTGANVFTAWVCEDGIAFRYGPKTASTSTLVIVGDLLEDGVGNQAPISIAVSSGDLAAAPIASPSATSTGGLTLLSGASIHFGAGLTPPSTIGNYMRDSGPKSAWFHPRSMCSFQLPLGETMKYKLRQIAYGPTPLASYETLTDTGAVIKAISIFPGTTTGHPWLTNFKV